MKLRSPKELAFRASQQLAGIFDYVLPAPGFRGGITPLPLQLPEGITGESYLSLAESILRHEFPIFGETISTGPTIDWRRDYRNRINTPVQWFRRISYLDFAVSGDHKYIWELNRHQHLVVLAQAWVLRQDLRYTAEIEAQITSWHEQNPYLRSVNWASALEIAFRALSWLGVLHLAGAALTARTRELLRVMLNQHAIAISHNLSTYFAPNTHILGEAVALHAIGLALRKEKWRRQGASIVECELSAQVQADGFHFEQSSYYHLYALDMFLFHYLTAGRPPHFEPVLRKMARAMGALVSPDGTFALIGDDDGGRFFHPYGERTRFAAATLETCAGLFPEVAERAPRDGAEHLAACGLSVFRRGPVHVTFDCGPFSRGGAGHSHADTLALTLRVGGLDVLVDPGTYTYVADPKERDWFRGTGSHCTLKLAGRDQADPAKPFRWENKPAVRRVSTGEWTAAGECSYGDWTHRRTVRFEEPELLRVEDEVRGPEGAGTIEQIWHSALPISPVGENRFECGPVRIEIDPRLQVEIRDAWRSVVFGSRVRSYMLVCSGDTPLESKLVTSFRLGADPL